MSFRERTRIVSASIPLWTLVLFVVSGILMLAVTVAVDFPRLNEAGYPDSYLLYDALHFQKTGVIYRDPATPPFPSAIYSPMLYVAISSAGRIVQTANPFLGPRILIFLAFMACVACVASITRTLVPARRMYVWGGTLALCIGAMPVWVLQLRSDFPGIAFSLLSIRLLLARGRWAALVAGAAAGMAFQFKITFVSAAVAGAVWLVVTKRWRDLLLFTVAGSAVGFGLYGVFMLREPRTIERLLSINLAIRDYPGWIWLIRQCCTEPVFILGIAAVPVVAGKGRSGWTLVIVYVFLSLFLAIVTATHAGANINYFFEPLFALSPIAAVGAVKLINSRWQWGTGSLVAALMITGHNTFPNLREVRSRFLHDFGAENRAAERRPFEILGQALPGHSVLSMVPRVSLIVDSPLVIEPYFLSYSQRLGAFDSAPIRARINAREFEAVVTNSTLGGYRGIPAMPADIFADIRKSYVPFCSPGGNLVVSLPRAGQSVSSIGMRLTQSGCKLRDTTALEAR